MRELKKIARPFLRSILKLKAHGVISRLCESDGVSKSLGEALRETLQNEVPSDEKMWIERIELHRDVLNASDTKITIVDYGAGKPGQKLSEDEMRKGREVTRTISEISKSASKPYFWSLLLFKLIRKFEPGQCLELGTSLGISAAYQAAALKLNGSGKIITLEGSDSLATLAKRHVQSLSLDNVRVAVGRFQDTLDGILRANNS
ncbi:MAG TPA: hypothetical protein VKA34_11935, partial [Balneolales bacterium]|nr:hypothetical protein [Balneolales bacterium]